MTTKRLLDFFTKACKFRDKNSCLLWPYGKTTKGRGQITINKVTHYVHRLVCKEVHGDPPAEWYEAAHSCGNGHLGCCNPHHLYWATPKQNNDDKILHGTLLRGEQVFQAKLTPKQIMQIRKLYGSGKTTHRELGRRFGVSHTQIGFIVKNMSWKHLENNYV